MRFHERFEVVLITWLSELQIGAQKQIFKEGKLSTVFTSATIEDASVVHRLIGVVAHTVPLSSENRGNRSSHAIRSRRRVYCIDHYCRHYGLLHDDFIYFDGLNYKLKGLRKASRTSGKSR